MSDFCINMRPIMDRVLIEKIPVKEGLIKLINPQKTQLGRVVAIGPGKWVEGYFYPTVLKPGQSVYFNDKWDDGDGLRNKENLVLVTEADIFGVVEDDSEDA